MMSGKGKPSQKKGILKLKEIGKGGSKIKLDPAEAPSNEMVSPYPLVKTSDRDRLLPRYSAVLRRNEEEGICMDDLDTLQLELETLLSAVAVRTRMYQEDAQSFGNGEDRLDKRGKLSPLLQEKKRVRFHEKVVVKKFRDSQGKAVEEITPVPNSSKFMKTKSLPIATPSGSPSETDPADPLRREAPKGISPKNDTPNKFWTFVDPYCSDITPDDIKLLETLIEENDDDADCYEIPPLGHHYSLRWAEEDNMDEKTMKSECSGISAKKSDKPNDGVATGPLTQRLLSALMEENFVPVDLMCKGDENRTPHLFKGFSVSNSSNFERRVRRELEEQGIFDVDEMAQDEDSDEILQELKRCQTELKRVTSYNAQQLKRLLKQANDELARQDLKKRLQTADNEVVEIHTKILAARQKKKVLSEKEQEVCWKALEERDKLLRHIDSI